MSEAPIMPFFTDAYLADCHHLSTQAHGAYLLILLHTWRLNGKPLPDSDEAMMRIVKTKTPAAWRELKKELAPFFDLSDGSWRQKRLEKTWADVQAKIHQNKKNAKLGGEANRKSLKKLKRDEANASNSLSPTMNLLTDNHEPKPSLEKITLEKTVSENSSSEKGEDDMLLSQERTTLALSALAPILKDGNYFLRHGGYRVSNALRPQIEQALHEIDAQIEPVTQERLRQLVMRLMTHFPVTPEKQHRISSDYADMLKIYPEDLLSAAYQHVLRHHKYHTLPKIADLVAFMDPELQHRRTTRRKLEMLMKQAT